jgi:hypothetical protein
MIKLSSISMIRLSLILIFKISSISTTQLNLILILRISSIETDNSKLETNVDDEIQIKKMITIVENQTIYENEI